MRRNVGLLDRAARLIIGVALLGLYGALESPWRYLTLLGLIFIATAVTAACPLYGLLGWSTRRASRSGLEEPPAESPDDAEHAASRRAAKNLENGDRTWPPKEPPPWRPSDTE